jgi:predicted nicotinamide N-methyase
LQQSVAIEHVVTRIADQEYPWTRVVDPDRLLESALQKHEDGSIERDPFWAATWRAAMGLDQYMGTLTSLNGVSVLELGGGSGRAGIAAALRGASVCITDASNHALMICRYNARYVADRVVVRRLEWSNSKELSNQYAMVLGSDIVYNPGLYPILEPCMRRAIAKGGSVILSEPQRHTGDRFESWIRAAGWRCNTSFVDLQDGERAIRIFECRLD